MPPLAPRVDRDGADALAAGEALVDALALGAAVADVDALGEALIPGDALAPAAMLALGAALAFV